MNQSTQVMVALLGFRNIGKFLKALILREIFSEAIAFHYTLRKTAFEGQYISIYILDMTLGAASPGSCAWS